VIEHRRISFGCDGIAVEPLFGDADRAARDAGFMEDLQPLIEGLLLEALVEGGDDLLVDAGLEEVGELAFDAFESHEVEHVSGFEGLEEELGREGAEEEPAAIGALVEAVVGTPPRLPRPPRRNISAARIVPPLWTAETAWRPLTTMDCPSPVRRRSRRPEASAPAPSMPWP